MAIIRNFIEITRIKKPTGIVLLLTPCLTGVFANIQAPLQGLFTREVLNLILLFTAGSVIMRSAGCAINDIFDAKFDKKVARTKNRPLASGEMTSFQAIFGLFFLLAAGFLILLQLNKLAISCAIISLFLVFLYPLMKRITYYPQIFLGIVFNMGFLIACLQLKSTILITDLLIYLALAVITFVYDTVYGFQDIEDDLKIGIKSSAMVVVKNPKIKLILPVILSFFLIFTVAITRQFNLIFYAINLFGLLYSILLILRCDFSDSGQCLKVFKRFSCVEIIIMISFILKL